MYSRCPAAGRFGYFFADDGTCVVHQCDRLELHGLDHTAFGDAHFQREHAHDQCV